jgi:hypothetical protein
MARIKAIPRKYINTGNQRSARKTPILKSGKKIIIGKQLKKEGKKGGKKRAKGLKEIKTRLVKKRYRYKPDSKL